MTRTPKNYDGNQPTGRPIRALLSSVLENLQKKNPGAEREIFQTFLSLLGPNIRSFVTPIKWEKGVLFVEVKNAAALSMMKQYEEPRILAKLPGVTRINYQGLKR